MLLFNCEFGFSCNIDAKNMKNYLKANKSGRFIPFYKNVKREGTHTQGLLYYDVDCNNDLELAVKPLKNVTSRSKLFAQFYLADTKMYIIAKIPTNETFEGYVISEDLVTVSNFDLLGTGSYTVYEIDLTAISSLLGKLVYIGSRSNTNNVDASFNGYIN